MKLFLKWFFRKLKNYALVSFVTTFIVTFFLSGDTKLTDLGVLKLWAISIPLLWFMVSVVKFWSSKEEKRHHSEKGTKFWE